MTPITGEKQDLKHDRFLPGLPQVFGQCLSKQVFIFVITPCSARIGSLENAENQTWHLNSAWSCATLHSRGLCVYLGHNSFEFRSLPPAATIHEGGPCRGHHLPRHLCKNIARLKFLALVCKCTKINIFTPLDVLNCSFKLMGLNDCILSLWWWMVNMYAKICEG